MNVGLIWAQTLDGRDRCGNAIPWRLPEDMAHIKATALGHPVVMGRKTWNSRPFDQAVGDHDQRGDLFQSEGLLGVVDVGQDSRDWPSGQ